MFCKDRHTENHAWKVASDPSASEEKWMAAVTLLDGKDMVAKSPFSPPSGFALPWALFISGAGATGAWIAFISLQYGFARTLAELGYLWTMPSYMGLIFGTFSVPCLAFSMLFTYRRLLADGGRAWKVAQWSAVLLYVIGMSVVVIDGKPVTLSDGGLLAVWNLACVGLAIVGSKLAAQTFKGLNQTIGARKVIGQMIGCMAAIPLVAAIFIAAGLSPNGIAIGFLLTTMLMSAIAVKKLNAIQTSTACGIATIIWTPYVLSNVVLLPAIAGTNIWLALTNAPMITWVDYVGAFGALLLSITAPLTGAVLASKHLQFEAARSLERGRDRLTINDAESRKHSNLEACFDD
jgi:hypothetical protein